MVAANDAGSTFAFATTVCFLFLEHFSRVAIPTKYKSSDIFGALSLSQRWRLLIVIECGAVFKRSGAFVCLLVAGFFKRRIHFEPIGGETGY